MSAPGLTKRQLLMRGARMASAAPLGLAACGFGGGAGSTEGGSSASQQPVTLSLKAYIPSELVRQAYDQTLEEWKRSNPTITIEPDFTNNATFNQQIVAKIASGTVPDVTITDWNNLADWALDKHLLPLDDLMKSHRISADEWFPGPMEYGRLRDKYYGLPLTGYTTVLYYNRDLFQRNGVPLPPAKGEWRWRELEAAAVRMTRRDPSNPQNSQWGIMPIFNTSIDIASAVWQNGGTITDTREFPTKMTLDQPKALEALQFLVDLRHRHQAVPTPEDQQALGGHPFVLGKVAMYWGPAWLFFTTMADVKDFWWDVAPGPRGPSGTQAAGTQPNHWSAFKATKHPNEAFKFVYFLTGGAGARIRAEVQSILVAHKRIMDDVWMKAKPAVNRQAVVDSHAYTKTPYKGRLYGKWNADVQQALGRAWNGELSVTAAAADAVQRGNTILNEAKAMGNG